MASEEEDQDDLIDPLIDNVPVYGPEFMTRQRRASFVTDVARKIDTYETISMRYGFADAYELARYLQENPRLRGMIKEERAIWFSSENAEIRGRELARRGTAECIPEILNVAFNETVTPSVRLEAVRTCARIAGMDGPGSREAFANAPDAGGRFQVNIHFSGANRTETIGIAPAPPPAIEHEE